LQKITLNVDKTECNHLQTPNIVVIHSTKCLCSFVPNQAYRCPCSCKSVDLRYTEKHLRHSYNMPRPFARKQKVEHHSAENRIRSRCRNERKRTIKTPKLSNMNPVLQQNLCKRTTFHTAFATFDTLLMTSRHLDRLV
jgi:hypothetical protein